MSEKEKSAGKLLEEQLTFHFPHIGKEAPQQVDEATAFCEGYKAFLNAGKTERECVLGALKLLKEAGYEELDEASGGSRLHRHRLCERVSAGG